MAGETVSPPIGVDCRRVCVTDSPHEGTKLWTQCACWEGYHNPGPATTAPNTSISPMDVNGSHTKPSSENIIHILVPSIVMAVIITVAIGAAIILYRKRRKSSANKMKSKAAYMKVENSYDYNGHSGMNGSRNNNDKRGDIYKQPSRQTETAEQQDYKARVSFLNNKEETQSHSPGGTKRTLLGKFPTSGSKGLQDKILEMTEIVDIESDQEGSPIKSKRSRSTERRSGNTSKTSRNSYAHLPTDSKYHSGSFG
ncbi:unnamed protein product [Owenia fusiformis]|uniref:Uncharacterized protein n=1 Tax=Owenia fusiformis TaxID=6347 RepID=A0A8J1TRQ1_OWEFU|nr:unnamed protein product [Owenia fusiformis]